MPTPAIPRLISSETLYEGRVIKLTRDKLEMDGGIIATRETIHHPGAVCMVPIDLDGNVMLVTQYRHPAGRRLLELPAGTLEPGEEPISCVSRELQEEIGMVPGHIEPLGGFYVAPGYTSEYIHLFRCTELGPSKLDGDEDEDIEVISLTPEQARAAVDSGEICDAKSVVGILRGLSAINR